MDNNNKSRTTEQELQTFVKLWKEHRKKPFIGPRETKASIAMKEYMYFLKEKDGVTFRRLAALTGYEVSPQYFNKIHKEVRKQKEGEKA